jgi:RimJ/RimL family protein N-acetyltransferase
MPDVVLATSRLLIRPLELADAEAVAAYRSDPVVARYQSWTTPYAAADARELVGGDPLAAGWSQYAIVLRGDQTLIGDLGVNLHENLLQAEIGATLRAEYQGIGYATEAVTRLLDHLFADLRLHKVSADCDARNAASARLLARVGFLREGVRRSHTWIKGEWTDDLEFGLLASDLLLSR